MTNLPRPSGKEMIRFLQSRGFEVVRVRGSHYFLTRGKQRTTVPVHANRTLKIGTLRGILRNVNMGVRHGLQCHWGRWYNWLGRSLGYLS